MLEADVGKVSSEVFHREAPNGDTAAEDRTPATFPPRASMEVALCADCHAALIGGTNHHSRCARCGAALDGPARQTCPWCERHRLRFDAVYPLAGYEGPVKEAVVRMKTSSAAALAVSAARLYCREMGGRIMAAKPTAVVPVPMHWRRRWEHGTNSAATLGDVVAGELGLPLLLGAASRKRNTPPQKDLGPKGRFRNVRGAFRLSARYDYRGARLLLVDDILTTGATCSELAAALKRAGARWIGVAVLARAQGIV